MINKGILIKASFLASFLTVTIGTIFITSHWTGANIIVATALLATMLFIILSVIEVLHSNRINKIEKSMWIIGLIFITSITGVVYILSGRKRIIKNEISMIQTIVRDWKKLKAEEKIWKD